jgi:hypothetical protein
VPHESVSAGELQPVAFAVEPAWMVHGAAGTTPHRHCSRHPGRGGAFPPATAAPAGHALE